ncbi:MAG: hypothetical protein CL609_02930 [Anaerolineaceae bacterium]|nr:hypothetical protein [Anaerolineaceae bacterium]
MVSLFVALEDFQRLIPCQDGPRQKPEFGGSFPTMIHKKPWLLEDTQPWDYGKQGSIIST